MQKMPICVAILSPIMAIRLGLRALLGSADGIDVIAESANLEALENQLKNVDVIVVQGEVDLDDWQPSSEFDSEPSFLLITDNPEEVSTLMKPPIRAWGIVHPEAGEDELIAALIAVDQGFIVVPPEIIAPQWNPKQPLAGVDKLIESLTPRETDVLQLLALGLANKQIALELEISEHTVKFHISSIYGKLGVTNRTEAVRKGLKMGLIGL